jgi:hypothetical protein
MGQLDSNVQRPTAACISVRTVASGIFSLRFASS